MTKISTAATLMVFALGACKSASNSEPLTPEKLADALVTVADLESQWNQMDRTAFTSRGSDNPAIDTSWCPEGAPAGASLIQLAGDRGALVEMQYKGATSSARLMSEDAWNDENAKSYMLEVAEAVSRCGGKTWTDDVGVSATLTKLSDATVGDESVAFSVEITPPASMSKEKFPTVWRTTVARIDNTIVVLEVWDSAKSNTAPEEIPDADWANIVSLAVDKLSKL